MNALYIYVINSSPQVPVIKPMELMVEASPRRIFANAHTYHINSISVNSDQETYLSADDLRINLWHLEITDQSFNIVDIKPTNMEELTEVITAAEFHPVECNLFVYSSSKGTIRLCDMRAAALCDRHSKCKPILSFLSVYKFSSASGYHVNFPMLYSVWRARRSNQPKFLFWNHFKYIRCETLKFWTVYDLKGLPVCESVGLAYGN